MTSDRTLGTGPAALNVSAMGLGCMGMSFALRQRPTMPTSLATVNRALDLGVDLPGHL